MPQTPEAAQAAPGTTTPPAGADLRDKIRNVPDFPKPGIVFRDITTLLQDGPAFRRVIDALAGEATRRRAESVVGIESRGFILGGAVAAQLGIRFIPARKPGRLPWKTVRETYELEYGTDALEIHTDALRTGERTLIIDDLLATGGTASATIRLVEKLGAEVVGVAFMIELSFLGGRKQLEGYPVTALIDYKSE